MANLFQILLTLVSAMFFGFLAVLVGIGGGLFYVPYLIFVLNLEPVTTLTSSVAILFTSTSGTIKYSKSKYIDFKVGFIFLGFAIPGSFLGSYVAEVLLTDTKIIKVLFACLIGGIATSKLLLLNLSKEKKNIQIKGHTFWSVNRKISTKDGKIFEYNVKIGFGMLFIFLGGFLAGILGVGGGLIFVPILSSVSGLPAPIAIATSTFMIVIVTVIVLFTRFSLFTGDIFLVIMWGVVLGLGSIIGGYIGASKVSKLSSKKLLSIFWVVAIFSALRIMIDIIFV